MPASKWGLHTEDSPARRIRQHRTACGFNPQTFIHLHIFHRHSPRCSHGCFQAFKCANKGWPPHARIACLLTHTKKLHVWLSRHWGRCCLDVIDPAVGSSSQRSLYGNDTEALTGADLKTEFLSAAFGTCTPCPAGARPQEPLQK